MDEKDLEKQEENSEKEVVDTDAPLNEAENSEESFEDILNKEKALTLELEEKYKRLQADFMNFRRRTEKERLEASNFVIQNNLLAILPVVDNFQRAIASEKVEDKAFFDGVNMIYNQLMDVLKNMGLEEIEAQDKKFDPNYHQAIMQEEKEDAEEDTILEVLQKGYMAKGKVIRPSMVKVSTK